MTTRSLGFLLQVCKTSSYNLIYQPCYQLSLISIIIFFTNFFPTFFRLQTPISRHFSRNTVKTLLKPSYSRKCMICLMDKLRLPNLRILQQTPPMREELNKNVSNTSVQLVISIWN